MGTPDLFPQGEGTIPQHLLRKYIMYARNNVRPQLHNIDQDKVRHVHHAPCAMHSYHTLWRL